MVLQLIDASVCKYMMADQSLHGDVPVTFTETSVQIVESLSNFDESDISNLIINSDNPVRGTFCFNVDYNEIAQDNSCRIVTLVLLISNHYDDEWNSGEEILVRLVDGDANKNSRADEDLDTYLILMLI